MKLNTHNSHETRMICVLWGLLGRLRMYPHHCRKTTPEMLTLVLHSKIILKKYT